MNTRVLFISVQGLQRVIATLSRLHRLRAIGAISVRPLQRVTATLPNLHRVRAIGAMSVPILQRVMETLPHLHRFRAIEATTGMVILLLVLFLAMFPRSTRLVVGSGIVTELSKVPLVGPPIDSAVTRALQSSDDLWTRQTYRFKWKHFSNSASHRLFVQQSPILNEQQRAVVNDLSKDGIAFVPFQALLMETTLWVRLNEIIDEFRTSNIVRERIKRYPAEFSSRKLGGDDYLIKLLPEHPTFELNDPLLQLFLNASLLHVVNSYLELWAKLIYVDVWHTIPGDMGRRIGSQNWHRDPEDLKMVKVYVYFSDVDVAAGPLEYVRGSNRQGPYGNLWKWRALDGPHRYRTEEELQREIPTGQFVNCVGPSGTVIFCDTSGFHRGGIATSGARVVATCTFVTPASLSLLSQRRFTVTNPTSSVLSEAATFALA